MIVRADLSKMTACDAVHVYAGNPIPLDFSSKGRTSGYSRKVQLNPKP